jgi:hypothetical protein
VIDPAAHELVFLGGLHRSGTTPLARVLAAHPDISGLTGTSVKEDEGQHLQPVYPRARLHGGPGRFAFSPQAHLTEESAFATPDNAARLLASWEPYWDTSRRFLLEKSPPNLVMTRFLQALFPSAAFVVIMRNPVVVALSTSKWVRLGRLDTSVAHWFAAHETFAEDSVALRRVHVVKYEELVARPAEALAEVGSFLGLTGAVPHSGWRPDRSDRYVAQWAELGRSRRGRATRRRIIDRYGERAARFGYDLEDLAAYATWSPASPT